MGPATSAGKADGKSLPVQIPTRKGQGKNKENEIEKEAHDWDIWTNTNT